MSLRFRNPDGSQSPEIYCEVKSTPSTRQVGMMYRKELRENRGMLFVFPREERRAFWMKNTYVPLDIIYLDSSRKVVSVVRNARPLSQSSLPSEAPAMYALEINAGLSKRWGIEKGSVLVPRQKLPLAVE